MNGAQPGMRVVGIRGGFVGYVTAVDKGCIQVDPAEKGDLYWLRADAVIGVEGNRVELICDASEVRRYLLEPPGS